VILAIAEYTLPGEGVSWVARRLGRAMRSGSIRDWLDATAQRKRRSKGRSANEEICKMTWGIPTHLFLQIHVGLSLIALVAGLIVLYGLLQGRALRGWMELFLVTLILTSVTGFPLPPFGLDPPRMVGILSLVLLAVAVLAIYVFRVSGPWRWIFVVAAMAALYLDAFVGVIQAFAKLPALHELAPTGSEPPFLIAQVIVLVFFVVLGFLAARRFHPALAKA
jgi:hypothetical protein